MNEPNLFSFNTLAVYVGAPGSYSASFESLAATNLQGIQSASIALTFPRVDAFGWDGGGNQEQIERPRAELAFSYPFTSGVNERNIGLVAMPNNTTSALSNLNTERNYYVLFNQEHQDLIGYSGYNNKVMAFGNAVLTNYSFKSAVGQLTNAEATVTALNLLIQHSGSGQLLPAVYKQSGNSPTGLYSLNFASQTIRDYFEAAPSNIALTFNTGCAIGVLLSGTNTCPVQSFSFSVDIPRQEIKNIGWVYPNTRSAQWPITININADAYLNGLQVDTLNRFVCSDSGHDFTVKFNNSCNSDYDHFAFQFNGAKLQSQNFTANVGGYAKTNLSWSLKVYDINRSSPNFYISSTGTAYSSVVFPQVEYVSGSAPLTFNLGTLCYLTVLDGPGILNNNEVSVSDEPATITIRATATDGTDSKDIAINVS